MDAFEKIDQVQDVDAILAASQTEEILVYKHSPICPVSFHAQRVMTQFGETEKHPRLCIIDVIKSRSASRYLAEKIGVRHESPQVLLLHSGKCVWNTSHEGINLEALKEHAIAA